MAKKERKLKYEEAFRKRFGKDPRTKAGNPTSDYRNFAERQRRVIREKQQQIEKEAISGGGLRRKNGNGKGKGKKNGNGNGNGTTRAIKAELIVPAKRRPKRNDGDNGGSERAPRGMRVSKLTRQTSTRVNITYTPEED